VLAWHVRRLEAMWRALEAGESEKTRPVAWEHTQEALAQEAPGRKAPGGGRVKTVRVGVSGRRWLQTLRVSC